MTRSRSQRADAPLELPAFDDLLNGEIHFSCLVRRDLVRCAFYPRLRGDTDDGIKTVQGVPLRPVAPDKDWWREKKRASVDICASLKLRLNVQEMKARQNEAKSAKGWTNETNSSFKELNMAGKGHRSNMWGSNPPQRKRRCTIYRLLSIVSRFTLWILCIDSLHLWSNERSLLDNAVKSELF